MIMLRLSLLRTHTTERVRPSRTKTVLAPAQAVLIPADSEKCRSDGLLFLEIHVVKKLREDLHETFQLVLIFHELIEGIRLLSAGHIL